MSVSVPTLGFTLGDPGGIGPEIVFKCLLQNSRDPRYHAVVFGEKHHLPPAAIAGLEKLSGAHSQITWVPCTSSDAPLSIGKPSAANGQFAYDSILKGIEWAMGQKIDALVTAPISKTSFAMAKLPVTDHTTLLQQQTKSTNVHMAFWSPTLKVILATAHCPLSEVPSRLSQEHLWRTAENTLRFSQLLQLKSPQIAVAGLNPHAGENGLFGKEEEEILKPWIQKWNTEHTVQLKGPYPADSVFYQAVKGKFDLVIALYHDQGLIPVKTLFFDEAVNITIGLPFIRTSPDHGTAFDIAYTHTASETSMQAAIDLAISVLPR